MAITPPTTGHNNMLIALLITSTLLLALSGLALMVLANAYTAFKTEYDSLLEEAAQDDATIDQLTAQNRELNSELQTTKHNAYHREQELLNALEDATKAADDNEWLYNDAKKDLHEACRELAELQEEHKEANNQLKWYQEAYYAIYNSPERARLVAEIAKQNEIIEGYQTEIHHKVNRIAELKQTLKKAIDYWNKAANLNQAARNELAAVKEELAETKTIADNLMTDRIEAIAHMKEQNEKIASLELKEFYDSCDDLDEAIEAAEEATPFIEKHRAWIAIGDWTRIIVYKHNPYQPYTQHGLNGKIERTPRKHLTTKAERHYQTLKAIVKAL